MRGSTVDFKIFDSEHDLKEQFPGLTRKPFNLKPVSGQCFTSIFLENIDNQTTCGGVYILVKSQALIS